MKKHYHLKKKWFFTPKFSVNENNKITSTVHLLKNELVFCPDLYIIGPECREYRLSFVKSIGSTRTWELREENKVIGSLKVEGYNIQANKTWDFNSFVMILGDNHYYLKEVPSYFSRKINIYNENHTLIAKYHNRLLVRSAIEMNNCLQKESCAYLLAILLVDHLVKSRAIEPFLLTGLDA